MTWDHSADRRAEERARELDRLRWRLFLFVPLLVGSLAMAAATLAGTDAAFAGRAAFAAFIMTAMVGICIPYGELFPSAPYALLGLVCVMAVRLLSDHFPDPLAVAGMAAVAALMMSSVAAYFVTGDLTVDRMTAISGCLAQAGAAAALVGFGGLFVPTAIAALMVIGVVAHALEIRRVKRSV